MGWELWTSPLTGHRRRGTNFLELSHILKKGLTAKVIYEDLKCCPFEAESEEMFSQLNTLDFDIAGVQVSKEDHPIGYVKKEFLLKGKIKDHVCNFEINKIISEETDIKDIIHKLTETDYIFIIVGTHIQGIITKSDVNKPPVRIYLFTLISFFEMHLNYWIDKKYPENKWLNLFPHNKLNNIKNKIKSYKKYNNDIDTLSALNINDKIFIVIREDNNYFNIPNIHIMLEKFQKVGNIRNKLAHSNNDILTDITINELFEIINNINIYLSYSEDHLDKMSINLKNNYTSVLY